MPKMSRRRQDVPEVDLDEQFEAFLKESISSGESSLDSARVAKYLKPKKQPKLPTWLDNESDSDDGLAGTGKSFLKPKKHTQEPPPFLESKDELPNGEVNVSRDSLDDVSLGIRKGAKTMSSGVGVPNLSLGSTSFTDTMTGERNDPGLDTLAEMNEKKKFFEELEKNSDGTLDFSRLNRELDHSSTLPVAKKDKPTVVSDDEETGSENDGEEDYEKERTVRDKNMDQENKRSMLSRVALSDSLDSTLGTRYAGASQETRPEDMGAIPEDPENNADSWLNSMLEKHSTDHTGHKVSLKTATGLENTNTTQEMEALRQALKQAGMSTMDSTKDFGTLQGSSSVAMGTNKTENTIQATDPDRTQHSSGFGLEPVLPVTDPDKSNIDELFQQVKDLDNHKGARGEMRKHSVQFADPDQDDSEDERGFALSPVAGANQGFDLSPINTGYSQEEEHSHQDPVATLESHSRPKRTQPRKDSFSHVKSSGYGLVGTLNTKERSSSKGQVSSKEKIKPHESDREAEKKHSKSRIAAKWSPISVSQQKIKGSDMPSNSESNIRSSQQEAQLIASVNSFASYIRDQFGPFEEKQPKSSPRIQYSQEEPVRSSSQKLDNIEREKALLSEVKDWQEQWKQERKINNKLRIEIEHLEKDNLRRLQEQRQNFEEQLFKLKQEHYVLQARISENHPSDLQRKLNELSESGTVSGEQIERLEKEIQEQEKLLSGYQQENERLYQQMKQLQSVTKTTEERLFRENDKLKTEVRELKEKLEVKEIELKTKGIITSAASQQQIAAEFGGSAVLGAGKIAQLEAELKLSKQREDHLMKEIDMLTKTKEELEAAINQLIKKVQEYEKTVESSKKNQSIEVKDLQKHYEAELEKLNRRLKWYAENQQLLDEDAEIIKQKDAEIAMLQEKINNVTSESGKKQVDMKNRAKERAADAKKIQDLERQVKEMETILRKRNPNSLPVLMWAASTAPDPEANKSPSVEFLEKQVEKLQTELESKDEDAKRSIRGMEQKFNAVKFQYEERISMLESRLSKYEKPRDTDHPHFHIAAMSKELDAVKERYRQRVAELEAEVEKQKSEVSKFKAKEAANQQKAADKALLDLQNKISLQQSQLGECEQEKTSLNGTVERLQKEKLQLQTELARVCAGPSSKLADPPEKLGKTRGRSGSRSGPSSAKMHKSQDRKDVKHLRAYTSSPEPPKKVYEPGVFAGSHISDVYKENEKLKVQLEKIRLQQDQEKVNLHRLLEESQDKERKARVELENQLVEMRIHHQQEVNKLLTEQVKMKSTSKIAEMQSQLDTQDVVIRHLKQQLNESGVMSEQISTLKIRETVLEGKVKQLAEELMEAKKSYTPEMRHFEALRDKLEQMEKRHTQREQELQRIIAQSRIQAASELDEESNKWRVLLESKNQEVEKFRSELDSILTVLKELQKQGVLLPGQSRNHSR